MLRAAAKQQNDAVRFKSRENISMTYMKFLGDCSHNFSTQDEEEVTSSFPTEVRKDAKMYGSILSVTNRPPSKGKTAEYQGLCPRGW